MDSQDYQHACERAELLGLPRPSEEEWRQTQTTQSENRCNDDEDDALQVIGEKNPCKIPRNASGVCTENLQKRFVIDRNRRDRHVFAERSVHHQSGSIRLLLVVACRSIEFLPEKFQVRVIEKDSR